MWNNTILRGVDKLSNENRIIVLAIVLPITMITSKNMFASTLRVVNNINSQLNLVILVLSMFLYIYCFYKIGLRIRTNAFFILLASTIFFIGTYYFNYDLLRYQHVIEGLRSFLAYSIPILVLVPLLHDTDELIDKFYSASYLMCAASLIVLVLVLSSVETIGRYSMSYGASTLLPTIFLLSKAFRENNIKDYILAGICTLAILSIGSRWPLLCIGAFIIYGFIFRLCSSKNKRKALMYIILAAIIFLIIAMNYVKVLECIGNLLGKFEISSRSIDLFVKGKATYDAGRSKIYQRLYVRLWESPLIGYGAFGGVIALDDGTAHNLFLDTWANFGYIFGSIILLYLIFMTIRYTWRYKGSSYGELIAIYACMIWPKATIGGGFWSHDKNWMLLSLILLGGNLKTKRKQNKGSYNES